MKRRKRYLILAAAALLTALVCAGAVFASDGAQPESMFFGTAWALVPPLVAIGLALITKEVYSSLFLGILVGAALYSGFSFEGTVTQIFQGGIIQVLTSADNMGILIFLVILGVIVSLMNRAGGSAAFGKWAGNHIKGKIGAQLATIILGVLIFIDDYFNCLTVGSVMRPVTDRQKISREKLAYLIDATAAPVCIIAPISSWAAAVTGFVEGQDGFSLFIQAIPYNFYALLTLVMLVGIVLMKVDFGPMKRSEETAELEGPKSAGAETKTLNETEIIHGRGKVIDLVLPVAVLILCCVIGMIYTGGFFSGTDFVTAFSKSDAPTGLVLGSFFGLAFTIVFYSVRRVMKFRDCMACLPEGFKAMVPAILILTFAWTLKAMTDGLGAGVYVHGVVKQWAEGLMVLLPAIIFLVGAALAFATGTSWGTFGILIPIVVSVFGESGGTLMIISISACMAGAVCGDHCSPISDTTIMASAGAQCEHVKHVSTQLPYVLCMALISFLTYLVAGFTQKVWISLPFGIILTLGFLAAVKIWGKRREHLQ
ncbi:Na+/H+ antiporter NhaC family protein [Cuneatibacter caecimuris]|uniref:Transporter (NhaC family) n=1 Tax=Cuneatibacter caecimuris TaxID=1796618 RepID=A0A4Q7NZH2_9FIRM|nr:Na+/H+ antiporter NhaC family protein [Cuneatibacter caecimuris]RZS92775.1 transporter (NhaC family) [Cuneatibacter caecimuris]